MYFGNIDTYNHIQLTLNRLTKSSDSSRRRKWKRRTKSDRKSGYYKIKLTRHCCVSLIQYFVVLVVLVVAENIFSFVMLFCIAIYFYFYATWIESNFIVHRPGFVWNSSFCILHLQYTSTHNTFTFQYTNRFWCIFKK